MGEPVCKTGIPLFLEYVLNKPDIQGAVGWV